MTAGLFYFMRRESGANTEGEMPTGDGQPQIFVPLTQEETETLQRSLANKTEEAARHFNAKTALEATQEKARTDALAEQGKYKELAEQQTKLAETATEKATRLEAEIAEVRTAQKAELDSITKDLTPEEQALLADESLPLPKRLALARHLSAKAGKGNPPPPGPVGLRGEPNEFGGCESEAEYARKYPDKYLAEKFPNKPTIR